LKTVELNGGNVQVNNLSASIQALLLRLRTLREK
jgi:hypothetical protein